VLGKSVVVTATDEPVYVRGPGGQRARLIGSRSLPVGSLIDVSRGEVEITSARKGGTQQATFSGTRFEVLQRGRHNARGLTTILLKTQLGCRRGRGSDAHASRRRRATLRGEANGHYRTQTGKGAGTVRGTIWNTVNACRYTDFVLERGVLEVVDFRDQDGGGATGDTGAEGRRTTILRGQGRFRTRGRNSAATVRGG
jgi:hypothetical protein